MLKDYVLEQIEAQGHLQGNKRYFKHTNTSYNVYLIAKEYLEKQKTVFVICANLYEAQKYYDQLSQVLDHEQVLFYPTDQMLTSMMALGSYEFRVERLFTKRKLLTKKPYCVVTTQYGVTQRTLKIEDYMNSVKTISKGSHYVISDIVDYLINSGYQRTYTVEVAGTFSLRGHILDVFTLDYKYPYRLDFFDDELEQIKVFDVETQRSFDQVDQIDLMPLQELFYTSKMKEHAIRRIQAYFSKEALSEKEQEKMHQDIEKINERMHLETLNYYIPFFNEEKTTIIDFAIEPILYAIETEHMLINEKERLSDLETYAQTMSGHAFTKQTHYLEFEEVFKRFNVIIDTFNHSSKAVSLHVTDVNEYQGAMTLLYHDHIKHLKKPVYLPIQNHLFREELITFLDEKSEAYETTFGTENKVYVLDEKFEGSFEHQSYIVIDEVALFSQKTKARIRYRSVLNQSTKIRHIDELKVGDYVVHYDYGIGQYVGLKTMEMSKGKRDYLHIVYAQEEALYIPVDQIDLVLKYSTEEAAPKLSKLGSKQWEQTKTRVKQKIKELSDRLITLYARREQAVGYAYSKDNDMQVSFDNDFEYMATKDQMRAIYETKHDMESTRPMDRLICGDVGFGKTEVALRAAFKAVLNAKQVFYLVPTTILARQHYYTFKKRFDKYGANVALLNRFVKPKRQREIIEQIKKGLIDVVIGTHRLLSKDVVFKDLGLLIVDEEQRFGVEHKERIKEIKINVDSLTLSATPIPRTMQMSMMGLKDLSMIETPPLNRYPVQTYVVQKEDALIKEAIYRELARGGQVFYLYNRVSDMERVVLKLKTLVPSARITFAHGKMSRDELEEVMSDFVDHHYDVLVATTIIETGVDIPNTNTLLIDEADKLGLSQLYQIRGRVGRSDRIAYAYMFYDARKPMNEESKKRLEAIQDFTALGSGYKIALRDLSIRGAGDILGPEQSGFIDSVGMELYMKLLNEAISNQPIKKEKIEEDVYTQQHIDPLYIDNDVVRIEIHKRIGSLDSIEDLKVLEIELEDRFGAFDEELHLYMYEKLFKKYSHRLGVKKMNRASHVISLIISPEASRAMDGEKLFQMVSKEKMPIRLAYINEQVEIHINIEHQKTHWLYIVTGFLDRYFKMK